MSLAQVVLVICASALGSDVQGGHIPMLSLVQFRIGSFTALGNELLECLHDPFRLHPLVHDTSSLLSMSSSRDENAQQFVASVWPCGRNRPRSRRSVSFWRWSSLSLRSFVSPFRVPEHNSLNTCGIVEVLLHHAYIIIDVCSLQRFP